MQPTLENRPTRASAWRTAMLTCVALGGLSTAALAQVSDPKPQPISFLANEDPASPGSFRLTFAGLGFETIGGITSTQFKLRIDHLNQTARFVEYLQHVEPLTLPGGISTGDITVEIVPESSTGTYDPLTRTFATSELYAVHFTADLSAYGLTSPVILPSSSSGAITLHSAQGGGVDMDWEGSGELPNPSDPPNPLAFTYRCEVNSVYAADADNLIGVGLSSDVLLLDLPQPYEDSLIAPLNFSLFHVQHGRVVQARKGLQWFQSRVNSLRGTVIPEAEADALIASAEEIISLHLGG